MQSARSCSKVNSWFNPTLFVKNCKRFWPIWLCYGLFWFFALPINLLGVSRYESRGHYFPRGMILGFQETGVVLSFCMGILCAMALFSYLYNSRSAGFYHSLPIRREGLFITNYVSGIFFFAAPILVIAVLTGAVECFLGVFDLPSVFTWAWAQFWANLFFFSFAVFCAMFTGHILALPVFYGVLNFLVVAITYVFSALVGEFLFGYSDSNLLNSFGDIAKWFTPLAHLASELGYHTEPNGMYVPDGMGLVFVYGLIGLVLAGCALAVYRRRQLERAGDVVTVGWAKPLFKYGVGFTAAVTLGMVLDALLNDLIGEGAPQLVCCMLVMGAVGYFVAEMLLEKSFKVFKSGWKGCAALLGGVLVVCLCLLGDLTGFERRVPDVDKVAGVYVDFPSSAPYDGGNHSGCATEDPAVIERVTAIHRAIVAAQAEIERDEYTYRSEGRVIDGYEVGVETAATHYLNLTYTMKNGGFLSRHYRLPITEEALAQEGSYADLLQAMMNDPAVVEQLYFQHVEELELDSVRLARYYEKEGAEMVDSPYATGADARAIYEAIRKDMAEGNLGRRYLLESEERFTNCYREDIQLNFRRPKDEREEKDSGPRAGSGSADTMTEVYTDYDGGPSLTVTIQKSAVNTIRALIDAGLIDSADDLTTKLEDYAS